MSFILLVLSCLVTIYLTLNKREMTLQSHHKARNPEKHLEVNIWVVTVGRRCKHNIFSSESPIKNLASGKVLLSLIVSFPGIDSSGTDASSTTKNCL